ncbi:hypothetical protein Mal4_43790 [Maioricimonas rarisocia]|uniref:Uncharacterized protein n=2 Tax=Maioricimonas rarisocia TaxID=2528026 RepID=A0A517ZC50_9PLAN|nr:hypothetical protein Mal4_43790 [Maioricimonas rarisocia]
MEFEDRLQRAIERGRHARDERGRAAADEAMTQEEIRNLHSQCRLELTERVEDCLRRLADHFPGFEYQSIVSDEGWGARITRDDLKVNPGKRPENVYSRLEMLVSPLGTAAIVELVAKGTIRNKEVFNRKHFQQLSRVDVDSFKELVDLWVLEYAEQFSSRN